MNKLHFLTVICLLVGSALYGQYSYKTTKTELEPILGWVANIEASYSIPLREESEIDYDQNRNGIGFKLGAGYQFEYFTLSLNWRRINFPGDRSILNPGSSDVKLVGNIVSFDLDGFLGGINKFHYVVGFGGSNHVFRRFDPKGKSYVRTVEKSGLGLRFGLGYSRQLSSRLRLSTDFIMDFLGVHYETDSFTKKRTLSPDVLLFHFTLGAFYCFGNNIFSK